MGSLVVDLATRGVAVTVADGRIVKPYLSAFGVIMRVNDQPLQVFVYPNEASLVVDIIGLADDASSVDGIPLSWAAAPHFWRKGPVLLVAVTDDVELVELIDGIIGTQFAGR